MFGSHGRHGSEAIWRPESHAAMRMAKSEKSLSGLGSAWAVRPAQSPSCPRSGLTTVSHEPPITPTVPPEAQSAQVYAPLPPEGIEQHCLLDLLLFA